jgi:hypothetical protein
MVAASFGGVGRTRSCCCVDATQELELKPIELCRLICAELSLVLPSSSSKTTPKDIVALAKTKLHLLLQPAAGGGGGLAQQVHQDDTVSSSATSATWNQEEEENASGTNTATITTIAAPAGTAGSTTQLVLSGAAGATTTLTVKDEARAIRQVIRNLPPSFWASPSDTITSNSTPEELVRRLLLQPPSVGGFCTGIACKRLPTNKKAIDTKSIYSQGDAMIHEFSILPAPGQYSTLDTEMEQIPLLVMTQRDVIKFHQTVFAVQRRPITTTTGASKTSSSQSIMLVGKGTKCPVARMVILLTSKFCLVGFYHHHTTPGGATTNNSNFESEGHALELMEHLRLEASGASAAVAS